MNGTTSKIEVKGGFSISETMVSSSTRFAGHGHQAQTMMWFGFDRRFVAVITVYLLLSFLLITALVMAAQAASAHDCSECHSDTITAALGKAYVHRPFMELRCDVCHVDDSITVAKTSTPSPPRADIPEKKIRWFDYTSSPAAENWFFLPVDLFNEVDLVVSASNTMGKSLNMILDLPAIETLPMKAADTKPPVLEAVVVLGVYGGILISAGIGWTTDEMAYSEVRYGIDSLQYSSKADALTMDHEILLNNLKANQVYQYVVVSRDMFGNSVVSENGTFSTEKLSAAPKVDYDQPRQTDIILKADFFRNEDTYLVRITANQPVVLKLGSAPVIKEETNTVNDVAANVPGHLPLRSLNDISTSVCRKCHAKMFETGNHAVNVMPTAGMVLPASYSTNSAGHIVCTTCHNPHASDFQYITVKSSRLELCIGCHKGYDQTPDKRSAPMLMADNGSDLRLRGNVRVNIMAQN